MRLGVVSDTHGLLRPEVAPALKGVDQIVHLGDVGDWTILTELGKIAPVTTVRGNVDTRGPSSKLPETDVLLFEGHYVYMLHDLSTIRLDPVAAQFSAVLSGHTHKSRIEWRKRVLYFNPGSCGPRRFDLEITIGVLTLEAGKPPMPKVIRLDVP